MKFMLKLLAATFAAAVIAACATTPSAQPGADSGATRDEVRYRLGAGDELRLIVFDEEELSGEFMVGGAGTVALPLIGDVEAEGLTLVQFQEAVEQKLANGYLNDPRVSVEVLNYRPYFILGEVNTPGEYPYREGLTVLNAVATAEGFSYRADSKRVFIKRGGADGEREYQLTPETRIQPGDTIRIPERFF